MLFLPTYPILTFALLTPQTYASSSPNNINFPSTPTHAKKPNFIIIMTDDQDLLLNSLAYQPAVHQHFATQGRFYKKHFCTMAQCCPSRVSLWTGMAGHNTNFTDVRAPYGMWVAISLFPARGRWRKSSIWIRVDKLQSDAGQLNNLWSSNSTIGDIAISRLGSRLDGLLMVLKTCKAKCASNRGRHYIQEAMCAAWGTQ